MIVNDFRLTLWGGAGASPGALRNFCRNVQPCRHRQGFYDFPDKIPCANVIGRVQVTVIDLPRSKPTDTVIVIHTALNFSCAVVCQAGSIPCVDMGYSDPNTVYLTCHHTLYIPTLPQMKPLPPASVSLSAVQVQLLEYHYVDMEFFRNPRDESCCLY